MSSLFYSKLLPRCCYFSNTMLKLYITPDHQFKPTDDVINESNLRVSSYLFVEFLPSNNSKYSRMPAEIYTSVLFYRECFIATKRVFIQAVETCFSTELSTDRRRRSEPSNNGFKAGQCSLVVSVSLSRSGNSFSCAWCFCVQSCSLPKLSVTWSWSTLHRSTVANGRRNLHNLPFSLSHADADPLT